mgnify:FL=1
MRGLLFFLFFTSALTFSQYAVEATFLPNVTSDWAILYKVEGVKKNYIDNVKIKKDTLLVEGEKKTIGKAKFLLPIHTKPGVYRLTYKLKGDAFVDFIFNKEQISFALHPDYPEQTVVFTKSEENKLYQNYLTEIANAQQELDSIQIIQIKNPSLNQQSAYKKALQVVKNIQNSYIEASKGKYVQPFIRATSRVNSDTIQISGQEYMENITATFFNNINFNNETLLNSSFLVDRIVDYVFYIHISDEEKVQQQLYKKSVAIVLSKISEIHLKAAVVEFLIQEFSEIKNTVMVDYLFENYFDKLPETLQSKSFKEKQLKELVTEVGRKAPDFFWKENGEKKSLTTLNSSEYYLLVFWSTQCSHCLNEIPKLHQFLKDKPNIKTIAFSLEKDDLVWKKMQKQLPDWHHVLGLHKWENKVARQFNINATPTYFILDKNKVIVKKPTHLKDVKEYINSM